MAKYEPTVDLPALQAVSRVASMICMKRRERGLSE
jgi:hypothetical protein